MEHNGFYSNINNTFDANGLPSTSVKYQIPTQSSYQQQQPININKSFVFDDGISTSISATAKKFDETNIPTKTKTTAATTENNTDSGGGEGGGGVGDADVGDGANRQKTLSISRKTDAFTGDGVSYTINNINTNIVNNINNSSNISHGTDIFGNQHQLNGDTVVNINNSNNVMTAPFYYPPQQSQLPQQTTKVQNTLYENSNSNQNIYTNLENSSNSSSNISSQMSASKTYTNLYESQPLQTPTVANVTTGPSVLPNEFNDVVFDPLSAKQILNTFENKNPAKYMTGGGPPTGPILNKLSSNYYYTPQSDYQTSQHGFDSLPATVQPQQHHHMHQQQPSQQSTALPQHQLTPQDPSGMQTGSKQSFPQSHSYESYHPSRIDESGLVNSNISNTSYLSSCNRPLYARNVHLPAQQQQQPLSHIPAHQQANAMGPHHHYSSHDMLHNDPNNRLQQPPHMYPMPSHSLANLYHHKSVNSLTSTANNMNTYLSPNYNLNGQYLRQNSSVINSRNSMNGDPNYYMIKPQQQHQQPQQQNSLPPFSSNLNNPYLQTNLNVLSSTTPAITAAPTINFQKSAPEMLLDNNNLQAHHHYLEDPYQHSNSAYNKSIRTKSFNHIYNGPYYPKHGYPQAAAPTNLRAPTIGYPPTGGYYTQNPAHFHQLGANGEPNYLYHYPKIGPSAPIHPSHPHSQYAYGLYKTPHEGYPHPQYPLHMQPTANGRIKQVRPVQQPFYEAHQPQIPTQMLPEKQQHSTFVDLEDEITGSKIPKNNYLPPQYPNNHYPYYHPQQQLQLHHMNQPPSLSADDTSKGSNLRDFLSNWVDEDEEGGNSGAIAVSERSFEDVPILQPAFDGTENSLLNLQKFSEESIPNNHPGVIVKHSMHTSSNNLPDIVVDSQKQKLASENVVVDSQSNDERLYVLESIEIPISELNKYKHLSVINKLPENVVPISDKEFLGDVEHSLKFLDEIEFDSTYYKNELELEVDFANKTDRSAISEVAKMPACIQEVNETTPIVDKTKEQSIRKYRKRKAHQMNFENRSFSDIDITQSKGINPEKIHRRKLIRTKMERKPKILKKMMVEKQKVGDGTQSPKAQKTAVIIPKKVKITGTKNLTTIKRPYDNKRKLKNHNVIKSLNTLCIELFNTKSYRNYFRQYLAPETSKTSSKTLLIQKFQNQLKMKQNDTAKRRQIPKKPTVLSLKEMCKEVLQKLHNEADRAFIEDIDKINPEISFESYEKTNVLLAATESIEDENREFLANIDKINPEANFETDIEDAIDTCSLEPAEEEIDQTDSDKVDNEIKFKNFDLNHVELSFVKKISSPENALEVIDQENYEDVIPLVISDLDITEEDQSVTTNIDANKVCETVNKNKPSHVTHEERTVEVNSMENDYTVSKKTILEITHHIDGDLSEFESPPTPKIHAVPREPQQRSKDITTIYDCSKPKEFLNTSDQTQVCEYHAILVPEKEEVKNSENTQIIEKTTSPKLQNITVNTAENKENTADNEKNFVLNVPLKTTNQEQPLVICTSTKEKTDFIVNKTITTIIDSSNIVSPGDALLESVDKINLNAEELPNDTVEMNSSEFEKDEHKNELTKINEDKNSLQSKDEDMGLINAEIEVESSSESESEEEKEDIAMKELNKFVLHSSNTPVESDSSSESEDENDIVKPDAKKNIPLCKSVQNEISINENSPLETEKEKTIENEVKKVTLETIEATIDSDGSSESEDEGVEEAGMTTIEIEPLNTAVEDDLSIDKTVEQLKNVDETDSSSESEEEEDILKDEIKKMVPEPLNTLFENDSSAESEDESNVNMEVKFFSLEPLETAVDDLSRDKTIQPPNSANESESSSESEEESIVKDEMNKVTISNTSFESDSSSASENKEIVQTKTAVESKLLEVEAQYSSELDESSCSSSSDDDSDVSPDEIMPSVPENKTAIKKIRPSIVPYSTNSSSEESNESTDTAITQLHSIPTVATNQLPKIEMKRSPTIKLQVEPISKTWKVVAEEADSSSDETDASSEPKSIKIVMKKVKTKQITEYSSTEESDVSMDSDSETEADTNKLMVDAQTDVIENFTKEEKKPEIDNAKTTSSNTCNEPSKTEASNLKQCSEAVIIKTDSVNHHPKNENLHQYKVIMDTTEEVLLSIEDIASIPLPATKFYGDIQVRARVSPSKGTTEFEQTTTVPIQEVQSSVSSSEIIHELVETKIEYDEDINIKTLKELCIAVIEVMESMAEKTISFLPQSNDNMMDSLRIEEYDAAAIARIPLPGEVVSYSDDEDVVAPVIPVIQQTTLKANELTKTIDCSRNIEVLQSNNEVEPIDVDEKPLFYQAETLKDLCDNYIRNNKDQFVFQEIYEFIEVPKLQSLCHAVLSETNIFLDVNEKICFLNDEDVFHEDESDGQVFYVQDQSGSLADLFNSDDDGDQILLPQPIETDYMEIESLTKISEYISEMQRVHEEQHHINNHIDDDIGNEVEFIENAADNESMTTEIDTIVLSDDDDDDNYSTSSACQRAKEQFQLNEIQNIQYEEIIPVNDVIYKKEKLFALLRNKYINKLNTSSILRRNLLRKYLIYQRYCRFKNNLVLRVLLRRSIKKYLLKISKTYKNQNCDKLMENSKSIISNTSCNSFINNEIIEHNVIDKFSSYDNKSCCLDNKLSQYENNNVCRTNLNNNIVIENSNSNSSSSTSSFSSSKSSSYDIHMASDEENNTEDEESDEEERNGPEIIANESQMSAKDNNIVDVTEIPIQKFKFNHNHFEIRNSKKKPNFEESLLSIDKFYAKNATNIKNRRPNITNDSYVAPGHTPRLVIPKYKIFDPKSDHKLKISPYVKLEREKYIDKLGKLYEP